MTAILIVIALLAVLVAALFLGSLLSQQRAQEAQETREEREPQETQEAREETGDEEEPEEPACASIFGGNARCPSCGALVKASDIRYEPQAFGSMIELLDSQRPMEPIRPQQPLLPPEDPDPRPRPYTLGMCSRCDPMRNGALEKWETEREGSDARAREEADQEEREQQERWMREDAARKGKPS